MASTHVPIIPVVVSSVCRTTRLSASGSFAWIRLERPQPPAPTLVRPSASRSFRLDPNERQPRSSIDRHTRRATFARPVDSRPLGDCPPCSSRQQRLDRLQKPIDQQAVTGSDLRSVQRPCSVCFPPDLKTHLATDMQTTPAEVFIIADGAVEETHRRRCPDLDASASTKNLSQPSSSAPLTKAVSVGFISTSRKPFCLPRSGSSTPDLHQPSVRQKLLPAALKTTSGTRLTRSVARDPSAHPHRRSTSDDATHRSLSAAHRPLSALACRPVESSFGEEGGPPYYGAPAAYILHTPVVHTILCTLSRYSALLLPISWYSFISQLVSDISSGPHIRQSVGDISSGPHISQLVGDISSGLHISQLADDIGSEPQISQSVDDISNGLHISQSMTSALGPTSVNQLMTLAIGPTSVSQSVTSAVSPTFVSQSITSVEAPHRSVSR
ncbi:hypothetical protein ACLOJK_039097 [Asimina triloba]